jgi:hypothetical protein
MGLLELLRDPQHEHYRFSAEVRQESTVGGAPRIGVFFAYRHYDTSRGREHCFCLFTLNDNLLVGRTFKNYLEARVDFLREPQMLSNSGSLFGDRQRFVQFKPSAVAGRQGSWHKLAVEVTPEKFNYFLEDELVNTSPRSTVMSAFESLTDDLGIREEVNPQFAPRDALGLYVSQCSASFRRVVVEPLGNEY